MAIKDETRLNSNLNTSKDFGDSISIILQPFITGSVLRIFINAIDDNITFTIWRRAFSFVWMSIQSNSSVFDLGREIRFLGL